MESRITLFLEIVVVKGLDVKRKPSATWSLVHASIARHVAAMRERFALRTYVHQIYIGNSDVGYVVAREDLTSKSRVACS